MKTKCAHWQACLGPLQEVASIGNPLLAAIPYLEELAEVPHVVQVVGLGWSGQQLSPDGVVHLNGGSNNAW